VPVAARIADCTIAVVATFVVLSLDDCVVAVAAAMAGDARLVMSVFAPLAAAPRVVLAAAALAAVKRESPVAVEPRAVRIAAAVVAAPNTPSQVTQMALTAFSHGASIVGALCVT